MTLMDKRYFVELTNKLYRLTFFFPIKEPLRHRVREVSDEILANLVLILEGELKERREAAFCVEKNIEMLDVLLELSKSQNWIEPDEIKKLQDSYGLIKSEVKDFNDISRRQMAKEGTFYQKDTMLASPKKKETEEKSLKEKKKVKLNKRQEKIIELLKKRDKMQVKDFQEFLKDATKRTLRRDLSDLVDQKIIERTGKGNMTYYTGKAIGQKVG